MAKLRKQRRRNIFRHNVNRKRLRNKICSVGKIACKEIENEWKKKKSIKTNLKHMGLSYDPNETIKIPSRKKQLKASLASNDNEWEEMPLIRQSTKSYVVKQLEADANAPRVKLFRLPKGQIKWVTYLMDKYANNYKAMSRDKINYNQETWKQIRAKIKRFKSIPEQYNIYFGMQNLSRRNLGEDADTDD